MSYLLLLLRHSLCRALHGLSHLIRRLRRLRGARRELLTGRRDLLCRVVRIVHELADTRAHLRHGRGHLAELIATHDLPLALTEITIAQPLTGTLHLIERPRDIAANIARHQQHDD